MYRDDWSYVYLSHRKIAFTGCVINSLLEVT